MAIFSFGCQLVFNYDQKKPVVFKALLLPEQVPEGWC